MTSQRSGEARSKDLDRLERILAKASKAPWEAKRNRHPNLNGTPWGWIEGIHDYSVTWSGPTAKHDADAIAAMRNALPGLINELRRFRDAQRTPEASPELAADADDMYAEYLRSSEAELTSNPGPFARALKKAIDLFDEFEDPAAFASCFGEHVDYWREILAIAQRPEPAVPPEPPKPWLPTAGDIVTVTGGAWPELVGRRARIFKVYPGLAFGGDRVIAIHPEDDESVGYSLSENDVQLWIPKGGTTMRAAGESPARVEERCSALPGDSSDEQPIEGAKGLEAAGPAPAQCRESARPVISRKQLEFVLADVRAASNRLTQAEYFLEYFVDRARESSSSPATKEGK